MPIAQRDTTAVSFETPQQPLAVPASYDTSIVDSRQTPISSIVRQTEGAPWPTIYYYQILGKDDTPRPQDASRNAVYQQYHEYRLLELRLINELSPQQDTTNNLFTVTGSAVFPAINKVPNKGDMLTADVGDGREGVFIVKNVERKNFMRNAVYEIEFELAYFADADPVRRQDLIIKSTETFVFHKDLYMTGEYPLLSDSTSEARTRLLGMFKTLLNMFYQYFFTDELNTFVIPNQDQFIYDPYVTKAIMAIMTPFDHVFYARTKQLIQTDKYNRTPTIYDILYTRNTTMMRNISKKMGLVPNTLFDDDPFEGGFRFSRCSFCVYPADITARITASQHVQPKLTSLYSGVDFSQLYTQEFAAPPLFGTDSIPLIYSSGVDDYYVFSEAFYQKTGSRSRLELIVQQYLDTGKFDVRALLRVVDSIGDWNAIDQFYYIPVILTLIRYLNKFQS